jgi:hypothetical protein
MKKTKRHSMGSRLNEQEQQINADYEWCLNDRKMIAKYSGMVVVVHNRTVWGAGKDHRAAWAAARRKPGCPPISDVAVVVVPSPTANGTREAAG